MTASDIAVSAPITFIEGEPVSMRATRVLLGWLPDGEAISQMLGRNPGPQDNLASILERIAQARAAVKSRPVLALADPVVGGERDVLDRITRRPELRASIPDAPWAVEWVDLARIVSIQKLITTDGLDERVDAIANDPAAVAELCLPAAQPVPPIGGFTDQDGLGFTISSLNPNLRAVGTQLHEALVATSPDGPPQRMQAITFLVSMGTSYLQVARYNGRYFLRDGYHRAAGLIRAGVTRVPAIVIDAPTFQYVTLAPGLFDHEVAFSDRPPLLTDFWEDSVAVDASQPTVRKVVRILAQQFAVQG